MAKAKRKRRSRPFQDLSGQTFGRWTVVAYLGYDPKHHTRKYLCRCECGTEKVAHANFLRDGQSRSCGCRGGFYKHGASSRKHARPAEYGIWIAMHSRCYGNHPAARRNYQRRGILVCARWRESYEAFLADMGPRPSVAHSIDRRDNDAHYSCGRCDECRANGWPANCRWATPKEQSHNRRASRLITLNRQTKPITEWARELGLHAGTIAYRLDSGMSEEEALTTPRRGGRRPVKQALI